MGIVTNWGLCQTLMEGTAHKVKKHPSYTEALDWLKTLVNEPSRPSATTSKTPNDIPLFGDGEPSPQQKSEGLAIYFDSGTGRKMGVEVQVANEQGVSLLPQIIKRQFLTEFDTYRIPPHKEATNNYGELLGCYFALQYALKQGGGGVVYGDSNLIVDYWSLNRANKKNLHPHTCRLIEVVATLRAEFAKTGGRVVHISGDFNPADLGFHK